MSQIRPLFKREFLGYFRSPVAYVFLIAFLLISVSLAFSRYGNFFKAGTASLETYFLFFSMAVHVYRARRRHEALVRGKTLRHR